MSSPLALHDGRAGNARQALALARALHVDARECVLAPRAPWRWLAPRALPGAGAAFGPAFDAELPRSPGLAIGCGRQAALAGRVLRAHGWQAVQILDPRIDPRHWDLVVAPAHDRLHGDNVIASQGSLHPVDDLWLARARAQWPALAGLPRPHSVLLVGAPSRQVALADAAFDALLAALASLVRSEGGSFSAVASRRTPPGWRAALSAVDAAIPGVRWRDARDGDNPYAGLLAHAGRIVCTPDSVNMVSEAAATLAPVFVWSPQAAGGRIRRFLQVQLDRGCVRALDDAAAPYPREPLRETPRIAAEVRLRLGLSIA